MDQSPKKEGPFAEAKAKWKLLLADERPLKKRVLFAALPCFALTFTLLFFGPVDLFIGNKNLLYFELKDILIVSSLLLLASAVLLLVFVCLQKGKLYDIAVGLVFALALAAYLQGNFFNISLGTLDGQSIAWHERTAYTFVNLLIWIAIIAGVMALRYLFKAFWHKGLQFVSLLIAAMQLAALLVSAASLPKTVAAGDDYMVYNGGMLELSAEENTIVLVLDAFPGHLVDDILEEYPDALNNFKDFTFFRNCSTIALGTFPALASMLTGAVYDPSRPYAEFFDEAWSNPQTRDFYGSMQAAGYSCRLFTSRYTLGDDLSDLAGLFDNVVLSSTIVPDINYAGIAEKMAQLSAYRYAPQALKPSLWMSTSEVNSAVRNMDVAGQVYVVPSTPAAYQLITGDGGLYTQSQHKTFSIIHTYGAHAPYESDANAQLVSAHSSIVENARGALFFVEEYLQQMKNLGVYDDANIIITADHGDFETPNADTLLMIKRGGETHAETVYNQAPVSTMDLIPTILYLNGLDYSGYGRPVYDFSEDEVRERVTFTWAIDPDYPPTGHYNVMYEYRFTGHVDDGVFFIADVTAPQATTPDPPTAIHPLADRFY